MSPGGEKAAIDTVLPILEPFSAKDPTTGKPCVAYIGPGGAGHYVKMVHNGKRPSVTINNIPRLARDGHTYLGAKAVHALPPPQDLDGIERAR